jgi:UDP-N-acetylglucosamine--N-acetylmuramyl-(pentapeptide) pyrophosphoryl-undecaprenol N-acetylglucosamine transferase
MERRNSKKILITGGGSGGHISVASALIEGIKKVSPQSYSNLIYVGGDLGMVGEDYGNSLEQKRFKNSDFKCVYIRAGKLQRRFSLSSIKLALRTFLGFIDAFRIIKDNKPDLIFSTGGFVSVPVCIAGWTRAIPIYLHEQTAAVGLANQIVSKFAKKIFTTFKSSAIYFKNKEIIQTGNIVRPSILQNKGEGETVEYIKNMKKNNLPIIYISGGGLGSHTINSYILDNINILTTEYNIILQMGDNKVNNDYEFALKKKRDLNETQKERFLPVKYLNENELGYLLHNIALYIGRAGANTVYEIGVLQIPSIFIPIPWVTHDEQTKNAQTLVSLGLSDILAEKDLDSTNISVYIKEFLSRELGINKKKMEELFPTNAMEEILSHIFN